MLAERNWVGWFYRTAGRQVGPVTRDKIVRLVAGGHLGHGEPVWKAWNEGDEFRLVQTNAEAALGCAADRAFGLPATRLHAGLAHHVLQCPN